EDGILPGYFGYETGQASVGDAFAWVARTIGLSHAELNERAAKLPAGSGGVMALDWLNGCRTPLMDGRLSGGFAGVTLSTRPEQLYRAMIEATAFGLKWIVETLREAEFPSPTSRWLWARRSWAASRPGRKPAAITAFRRRFTRWRGGGRTWF